MKHVYVLIALLTVSAGAYAKGEYQAMITAGPVVNGKIPHFGSQITNTTGGGGSAPSKVSLRVIGRTYATFIAGTFVPVDSYYYRYENDRGGVLNNQNIDNDETLLYTEGIRFKFDQGTFVNRQRRIQIYDVDNNVTKLTYQFWRASQGDWRDSARYLYAYDNGKMIESTFEQFFADMWTNGLTSTIGYGQGTISMESNVYKAKFVYDVNSRLVETIDSQKNMNGVWETKEKHTYEYIGNNVKKHVFSEWSSQSNSLVNRRSWDYLYSGNDVISAIESEWINGAWVNVNKHEYTYDGNHNLLEDITKVWNAGSGTFLADSREVWIYNIQNLPELITTSSWNGNMWVSEDGDKQYRLYYENFFPSLVPEIATSNDLILYPVPASEQLNVNLALEHTEDISVVLYDIKGSILHISRHTSINDLKMSIPVSGIPAGTYLLRVVGNNMNMARSVMVHH